MIGLDGVWQGGRFVLTSTLEARIRRAEKALKDLYDIQITWPLIKLRQNTPSKEREDWEDAMREVEKVLNL